MEILHVCPAFFPYRGGVETYVREVSKRLADLGVGVRIFTTDPSGRLPKKERIDGVEVSRFKSFSPNQKDGFISLSLYLALKKLKDIGIIHAHSYPAFPAVAAAMTKRDNGKRLVFTPHYGGYEVQGDGNFLRTIIKKCYNYSLGRYIFDRVDTVTVTSEFEIRLLNRKFGLEKRKVHYIPNGVNVKNVVVSRSKEPCLKTILYVGRLEKYKGVQFLVAAFSRVKNVFPDARLVIVGNGTYKKTLISLVNDLKLRDSVRFLENVSDQELTRLYSSSSIFVTLPQYEPFGIALVEAMAYGLPVIATKVGGIPELVRSGETGFLLDFPPNENTLTQLISFLLENVDFSINVGHKAKMVTLSRFSWDRTAHKLYGVYELLS